MIRYIAILVLSIFALGAWAQNSPPHQHAAAALDIVDGSRNPELIPDSTAYRVVFLHLSVPASYTSYDKRVQLSHLTTVGLEPRDSQAALVVLADFRSQYDAWVARWNAEAARAGVNFSAAVFVKQEEDMVQAIRDALKRDMTPIGMLKFDAFVQSSKRSITLHRGGVQ